MRKSGRLITSAPFSPVAGAYQAWQAVTVERHPLPAAEAHQLAAILAAGAPQAPTAAGARGLCATRLSLHCTLLPAEPSRQPAAVDMRALAEEHLQPALLQLADAQVSSSMLRHPPPLHEGRLRWDAQAAAYVLPASAAAAWGQHVHELAWSASLAHADGGEQPTAAVLLFVPPAQHQPLLLEQGDGSGSRSSSMELADGSLLLIVNQPASSGSCGSSDRSVEEGLASQILPWLLAPLQLSSRYDSSTPGAVRQQLQRSLAAACAAEAATALQRFVNVTAAVTDQPVTTAAGHCAARAVQLLQAVAMEQQQEQQRPQQGSASAAQLLAAAQGAWMAAQQLLQDPGTGARPVFPPEHALAVLLPLALPVTLVLVQAAGREAAAWKKRRREQQAEQQGEQQGEQQLAPEPVQDHTD
jgi:hypothetical protein